MSARAYTVATLAEAWKCSEGVIRKLIVAGQLRSFRVGALIRIPADEVHRFECQNIASNDSAADMRSSTVTQPESADARLYAPPIASGRRPRHVNAGGSATLLRGPWEG